MLRHARFIVVAVVVTFLTALPSQGLPLRAEGRAVSLGDWATLALGRLWAYLTKEGGLVDPSGACAPGQACGMAKEGLNVDPHGICVAGQACAQQQPAGEEGVNVDPSGGE
jgi:hypothetical protein